MPAEARPRQKVRTRQVFYIPGYDPVPPRRYRELYRTEGAEQARVSGYDIAVTKRAPGVRNFGWGVAANIEDTPTETQVEVLYWSDIVQKSMDRSIPSTYLLLARTAWEYIATGALGRLMKLRIGPILAALYPVAMLLAQLLAAILVGVLFAWMLSTWVHPWAGAPVGLGSAAGLLWWFRGKDGKLFAYYLMHDYGYSARFRGQNPPELEARMAEFTARIARAMDSDVDEVLVVGHSSGAHLAVSILADLIRSDHAWRPGAPQLSLLTLGQVIPMVSFLRDAHRLRADLAYLGANRALCWVDVSAPGDGATFALCDPVAVSGVAAPDHHQPLIVSAAFTQTLSDEKRAELGRRFFRLHFQYLCAFDRPGDYDYFRITAGPMTLAQRFAHRAHSPSRIAAPVNKFTRVTA
ncbi:MAG: hypothetical protein AAF631_02590 [Pseudomonadota bacterium]